MRLTEAQVQEEQRKRYQDWVKSEGGVERAVLDETYQEPAQVERTKWLVEQVEDLPFSNSSGRGMCRSILELGCSNGHQLLAMQGMVGIDLNPEIIKTNMQEHPEIIWLCEDITKGGWDIRLPRFDCVVLPEILEHLEWHQVKLVIRKAKQLAKKRLLVTIPNATDYHKNQRNWASFKHRLACTEQKLTELLHICREGGWQPTIDNTEAFIQVRLDRT